jgi:hypothetical protein
MLKVSTSDTDRVDSLFSNPRVCCLASKLKLSLFAIMRSLCASVCAFMATVSRDSHDEEKKKNPRRESEKKMEGVKMSGL